MITKPNGLVEELALGYTGGLGLADAEYGVLEGVFEGEIGEGVREREAVEVGEAVRVAVDVLLSEIVGVFDSLGTSGFGVRVALGLVGLIAGVLEIEIVKVLPPDGEALSVATPGVTIFVGA